MSKRYVWDHITAQLTPREDGEWVRYSDLAASLAEIERLKADVENLTASLAGEVTESEKLRAERDLSKELLRSCIKGNNALREKTQKAIAERDQAVAAAYEAAAEYIETVPLEVTDRQEHARAIRDMTPTDTQAALEAYGRKKVWEGMHLAATIAGMKSAVLPHYPDITRGYAQGRSGAREAILAKMEKLK